MWDLTLTFEIYNSRLSSHTSDEVEIDEREEASQKEFKWEDLSIEPG